MKTVFRGWRREQITHERDVHPVTKTKHENYSPGAKGDPLVWQSQSLAFSKLNNLGLSGNFLLEMHFNEADLKGWLEHYVSESPERAIPLLAAMQATAMLALVEKSRKAEREE